MRIIGHLDMDAFFAAVEERDKPRIKGLPIVVGSDPAEGKGRGVVSTANYKAREYGIYSATPISTAWRLSEKAKKEGKPEAVFLPVDFKKYEEVSREIMAIIRKYSAAVEEASIDEAYFDLSCPFLIRQPAEGAGGFDYYGRAEEIAKKIKADIFKKEKLTCSVGIGPNKLIAKIASGFKKPNGLTIVGSDNEATCREFVERFLEPLKIRDIPGIGPKSEIELNKIGVKKVKDLKKISQEKLKEMFGKPRYQKNRGIFSVSDDISKNNHKIQDNLFSKDFSGKITKKQGDSLVRGKWGEELYEKIRGRDDSPLVLEWEAKSIGEQETFLEDTFDVGKITVKMKQLCQQVFDRFADSGFKSFKNITITVRFNDFETKTRSHTLKNPVNDLKILEFEALKILLPFLDKRENPGHKSIRLLGVRIEKLG